MTSQTSPSNRTDREPPRYWNIWWTLTVIAVALTVLAGVLEALNIL